MFVPVEDRQVPSKLIHSVLVMDTLIQIHQNGVVVALYKKGVSPVEVVLRVFIYHGRTDEVGQEPHGIWVCDDIPLRGVPFLPAWGTLGAFLMVILIVQWHAL